ncbi:condensation domain-containing protein [Lentzea sp. NPDC004782]|uniref:condensation domain-containing protein n=1 Tax=Lentzea sp. NPDC004782 TaxID=3154458 RepID=UPI0033A60450
MRFSGLSARTSALTWGQRWIWDEAKWFAPRHEHFNMRLVVDVPETAGMPEVLDCVRVLLEARESLRTTFPLSADGVPFQNVVSTGRMRVEVRDAVDPVAFATELQRIPFATDELPVRFGVVTADRRPRHIVAVVFHLTADGWDIANLSTEIERFLASGIAPLERLQPVDQAEREAGAKETSDRAIRYWKKQLAQAPAAVLPLGDAVPRTPRFQEVLFESDVMAAATYVLSQRLEVSQTAIFLALTAAQFGGNPLCCFTVCCRNRLSPEEETATGTYVQDVPVTIDVSGPTFADLVRHTWRALLPAYAAGRYDPVDAAAAVEEAARERGTEIDLSRTVNVVLADVAPAVPDDVGALRTRTRITTKPGRAQDRRGRRLYLRAHNYSGNVQVSLRFDTLVMSTSDAVSFLESMEQRAVDALTESGTGEQRD